MSAGPCIHCSLQGASCTEAHCDRVQIGKPWTPDQCRPCWLRLNDLRYKGHTFQSMGSTAPAPQPLLLGDMVEKTLSSVGITQERVRTWIGSCGCSERKRRLNELHKWANGALEDTKEKARSLLSTLLGG